MADNEPNFFERNWRRNRRLILGPEAIGHKATVTGKAELKLEPVTMTAKAADAQAGGRADLTLEPLTMTAKASDTLPSMKSDASGVVRPPVDERRPHVEGGISEPVGPMLQPSTTNLELQDGSNLELQDRATDSASAPTATAEQIQQGIRSAFRGDRAAILRWTEVASDITAVQQTALDNSGINDTEEIRGLLADQATALDNIRQLVEAGATDEAEQTYQELLDRLLKAYLEFMAKPGAIRGTVAGATLAVLGLCSAFSPVAGALVAGAIVGLDGETIKEILIARGSKK